MRWGRIAIWVLAALPGVILAAISGVLLFGELLGPPAKMGPALGPPARFMAEPCHVDLRRDFVGLDGRYYFDDMAGLAKRGQGIARVRPEDPATRNASDGTESEKLSKHALVAFRVVFRVNRPQPYHRQPPPFPPARPAGQDHNIIRAPLSRSSLATSVSTRGKTLSRHQL